MQYLYEVNIYSLLLRLLLATILGGIVGFEREDHNRPAGLRTHIIVCLGSAMVMILSQYANNKYGGIDITRMGAQVISGIGFLGAGTIIINGDKIRGLTTAAGLWTTACMGLAIGVGYYEGGLALGGFILFAMIFLRPLSERLHSKATGIVLQVELENIDVLKTIIGRLDAEGIHTVSLDYQKSDSKPTHLVTIRFSSQKHFDRGAVVGSLSSISGIYGIEVI